MSSPNYAEDDCLWCKWMADWQGDLPINMPVCNNCDDLLDMHVIHHPHHCLPGGRYVPTDKYYIPINLSQVVL